MPSFCTSILPGPDPRRNTEVELLVFVRNPNGRSDSDTGALASGCSCRHLRQWPACAYAAHSLLSETSRLALQRAPREMRSSAGMAGW